MRRDQRFRDALPAHSAARAAYGQLKLDLAARYADDRAAYSAAKTAFVQDILEKAEAWIVRSM